jgi:predicted RNA-binding protein with PUA-like domain
MAYWILRSEPEAYSWNDLVRDRGTEWDGVRNYAARNFLKEMQPDDGALFYHSGKEKAAVGVMEITRAWKPDGDPNAKGGAQWASVHVEPRDMLAKPVTLAAIKAEPKLAKLEMLRQSRLSVTPVRAEEWRVLLQLSQERA